MPDRSLRKIEAGAHLTDGCVGIDQVFEFAAQRNVRHQSILPRLGREPIALRQGLNYRPGYLVVQPSDYDAAFDLGRPVVNWQQIARVAQVLLARALFRSPSRAVP